MRRPEVGILALAMLASACSVPTDMPNWDMTWNLPVPDNNGLSIPISSFIPTGVTIDSSVTPRVFKATPSGTPQINRTLGAQCPACPNATAPKPAFTAPAATTNVNLAAGTTLNTATLTTGSKIDIALNNGFGFDPIRPPGGSTGTVILTVSNGATTLGNLTLSGATSAIPAGQTTNVSIPLAGTLNTASAITVTMTMDSPAGALTSPVTMNSTQTFTATASPVIAISAATVTIAAQSLSSGTTPIDMSSIDSSIVNRITNDTQNRGTMFLTITNPLTIGANATITFKSPAGVTPAITPITKNITVPPATNASTPITSTISVNLTGQELRRMFGHKLDAVFGGTTAAGSVAVTPTLKITSTSRIQVNFNVKEVQ
jgi:hypothetical protein